MTHTRCPFIYTLSTQKNKSLLLRLLNSKQDETFIHPNESIPVPIVHVACYGNPTKFDRELLCVIIALLHTTHYYYSLYIVGLHTPRIILAFKGSAATAAAQLERYDPARNR